MTASIAPQDTSLTIGLMRKDTPTGGMAVAMAHAALMQGARLVAFTPADVDLHAGTIRAHLFSGQGWHRATVPLPDVVDNDDWVHQSEVWDRLVSDRPFTMHSIGGKAEAARRMANGGFHPELQIPARFVSNERQLRAAVDALGAVVIKPVRGAKGMGVEMVRRDAAGWIIGSDRSERRVDGEMLDRDVARALGEGTWIAQRYIHSRTAAGLPFDVRIHVRRNHVGHWQHVKTYVRVGSGSDVRSNLAAGGSVAAIGDVLSARYAKQAAEVQAALHGLARDLAPGFQRLYPHTMLDALGFDLGLDEAGRPWLFEVNCYPGARTFAIDAAIPRVGYAIWLARRYRAGLPLVPPERANGT